MDCQPLSFIPRLTSHFLSLPVQGLRKPFPTAFRIAVIADLDKRSRVKDAKGKEAWHSKYMTGTLRRSGDKYAVEWDPAADVFTAHNEAGRGCELSELVLFNKRLLSFDDRTGIVFEVQNFENSGATGASAPVIVPRQMFMEGDGQTDKGMKIEWATVKDGLLWVGSFGKEYTDNNGGILHANNLWVKVMSERGVIQHVNWQEHYDAMRKTIGYEHPAYLLHEAITWSPYHRQWFVLPRRMSKQPYDEVADEKMGANTIITASPDFSSIASTTVGRITPERGFSTFKFLPGSRDTVIVALKSEENSATDSQTSYITVYGEQADGSWKVLLEETELPGASKFEGLEVIEPVY